MQICWKKKLFVKEQEKEQSFWKKILGRGVSNFSHVEIEKKIHFVCALCAWKRQRRFSSSFQFLFFFSFFRFRFFSFCWKRSLLSYLLSFCYCLVLKRCCRHCFLPLLLCMNGILKANIEFITFCQQLN